MSSDALPPQLFLGRLLDSQQNQLSGTPFLYDPVDLTTHAIITGMTGSGKTGLGIAILEEAALKGIPAIIIDPKGDLTNLLLHFPDLAPKDFEPWINPDTVRLSGGSLSVLAETTAKTWQDGLQSWGLGRQNLLDLQAAVDFTIYTPGSSSGKPVNLLSSFETPSINWEDNREALRERITSSVTALLGLVGLKDVDPLRSREHILLANLIETAWSKGAKLDLTELILQVQKPPFERLGAFPLDSFYPEKDRFDLALLLNSFLASPSFQAWQEGQTLSDVQALLYTPQGKPRHAVFYIAHLSETERMFFVTLLLATVESWMRAQRGASSLQALLYFDELVGYLPPVENPPSRPVLLRLLKQARAFGLGLVLATQNPVDVDYKALSNTGTWLIGRLQTEQDRERLLDGLLSAMGNVDRAECSRIISGLQKRSFLMNNVHAPGLKVFGSRWTLNYLAGPVARNQIKDLNQWAAQQSATATAPAAAAASAAIAAPVPTEDKPVLTQTYFSTRPAVPAGVDEVFLPNSHSISDAAAGLNLPGQLEAQGIVYHPVLFAQAQIRYLMRSFGLDYEQHMAVLVTSLDANRARWENSPWCSYQPQQLQSAALPQSRFGALASWMADARLLKTLGSDFEDWVYRSGTIKVKANDSLKIYAAPNVTLAEFRTQCSEAAQKGYADDEAKLEAVYARKIDVISKKIDRQKMDVSEQQAEVNQRGVETLGAGGELLFSLFSKRRRSINTSLSKMRLTEQAKADLQKEQKELEELESEFQSLQLQQTRELQALKDQWAKMVNDIHDIPLPPARKDIFVERFGIAWQPYYVFKTGDGKLVEASACTAE